MRWPQDYDFCTPPRNAGQSRETSHGSGHSSDTVASHSSNNSSRYQARYNAGLSKVLDDRVGFLSDAHDASVRAADGNSQVSPRASSGTGGRAGRGIGDWKTFESLEQTPPHQHKDESSTTPEKKTPFRTPHSSATTVFYTPVSSWDRESDVGPSGDYELVNTGSGKDWLVNGDSKGAVDPTGESETEEKPFLSLNKEYLSVERCHDLLSKTYVFTKEMAGLLKVMGE